jgi:hypothetical protein
MVCKKNLLEYQHSKKKDFCYSQELSAFLGVYGKGPSFRITNTCYDPTLITKPKTFHIKTISAIFHAPSISFTLGKLVAILRRILRSA